MRRRKGKDYGYIFGKVMQQVPNVDVFDVNAITKIVLEEDSLLQGKCPACEWGWWPHRNCIMR